MRDGTISKHTFKADQVSVKTVFLGFFVFF